MRLTIEAGLTALREQYLIECEQRRTFLWVPVIYAAGILVYFQVPREPYLPAIASLAALAFSIGLTSWRSDRSYRAWIASGLVALGALSAQMRTLSLSGEMISEPVFAGVSGTVESVQVRAGRTPRIVIGEVHIDTARPIAAPERVRITLLGRDRLPDAGDRIKVRARLSPVPGPVTPGGYDPRRAAFFDGIGGSGFAVEPWTLVAPASGQGQDWNVGYRISGLRRTITDRIRSVEGGPAGAVAAALLVGERGYLPVDLVDNLRNAGLAHILAISGLHMALFSGTIFFALRGFLAMSPSLALTRPIKKWSAITAIVAGLSYLMISGGNVATYRAFIMAAIMFGAILVDRPAISLRNLAFAALIILALEPESVAEPGFQMSFAAVMALVAYYEWWRNRDRRSLKDPATGLAGRALRSFGTYAGTVAMTTVVAGFATAPIAIYHFNHVALYSLAANLMAMPILALVVMPAGLLSLVMMPFGLEGPPLAVMGIGAEWIIDVASVIGGRDDSHLTVPSIHWAAFAALITGMVWTCLWQRGWRWIGLVFAIMAVPLAAAWRTHSDLLVNASGKMVAARDDAGAFRISARRANPYVLEEWLRREGVSPEDTPALSAGVSCDDTACMVATVSGYQIAHIRDFPAFAEECRPGVIVVTHLQAPSDCAAALVIDQAALSSRGAHAISLRRPAGNKSPGNSVLTIETAFPATRRALAREGAGSLNATAAGAAPGLADQRRPLKADQYRLSRPMRRP